MKIMVTGGSGYIGAHAVEALVDRGDEVVVLDDLVSGRADRVRGVPLVQIDLAHTDSIEVIAQILRDYGIEAVIHFAARKQVGESVEQPALYYQQNLGSLTNLLLAMERARVTRLVFSSTAATYAISDAPIDENHPTDPPSPYGQTKLSGEQLISAVSATGRLDAVSLRYFNVAGARRPELGDTGGTNLVPLVLNRLEAGERPLLFGDDYDTPDGTCIRDYVHVTDVVEAHLVALDSLDAASTRHRIYNVGTGIGTSVREIVRALTIASGRTIEAAVAPRRAGDPVYVVAAADSIRKELGWNARLGLDDIVASAWESHQYWSHPELRS